MADQNTNQGRRPSGCFGMMKEMMRSMMSRNEGSGCSCTEQMAEMMSGCCSAKAKDEGPVEAPKENAPR